MAAITYSKGTPAPRGRDSEWCRPARRRGRCDNRCDERGMFGHFILDDFERPDAGALVAPAAQEQAAVPGRAQEDGAGGRQVCPGVEVLRDADGMLENRGVDIIVGVHVEAPHKLDKLPRLGLVVAARFVYGFADEVERHFLTF